MRMNPVLAVAAMGVVGSAASSVYAEKVLTLVAGINETIRGQFLNANGEPTSIMSPAGSLGGYGYNPNTKEFFFGGSGSQGGRDIRVWKEGDQYVKRIVTESQQLAFYQNGNGQVAVSNALAGSLLLNPADVKDDAGDVIIKAYGTAVIADQTTPFKVGTETRYDLTPRFYRLDVEKYEGNYPAVPVTPPFVRLVSSQDIRDANGTTSGTAAGTILRQIAYSGDGKSYYFTDTNASNGGLYKAPILGGSKPVRLTVDTTGSINTEPAVITVGGVDSVYVKGRTANDGGIDVINGNTGARATHVTRATLNDFFERTGTSAATITAMAADESGSLYFSNTSSNSNLGIFRLDQQGRLVKLAGQAQRTALAQSVPYTPGSTTSTSILRLQVRDTTYTNDANVEFGVKQLMYADANVDGVVGVNLFKTGDFDFDNSVTAADFDLFGSALTLRGQTTSDVNKQRFDLNGNNAVDWKDVKILQSFAGFDTGSIDFQTSLDFADIDALEASFRTAGHTWTSGDFTGDAQGLVAYDDIFELAKAWVAKMPAPTAAEFDAQGYSGDFRQNLDIAFAATVPEPAVFGAVAVGAGLLLRRRSRFVHA